MTNRPEPKPLIPVRWQTLGLVLAGVWIFGGAVFFLLRFSLLFYLDNQMAIERAIGGFLKRF